MRSHRWFRSLAVLAVLVLAALPLAARGGDEKPAAQPATQPAAGDQAAMMKAYMEAAAPGPQHQWLADAAGDWNVTTKSWMQPGAPPEVSQGTSHREMILGGRVLQETVSSTMMGAPFHGQGMSGYDNTKKSFWGTWADTMGTGVGISEGSLDRATQTLTWQLEYMDPATKKVTHSKMVTKRMGKDKEVVEFFGDVGGKEAIMMELTYERAK